jgi:tetratricopeptide (TPR) repeat protein
LIADRHGAEGHYEESIATYERALAMLNGLGEHAKTGAVLNNMAIAYADRGKLDRAAQLYREAKAHFEQGGDKSNTSTAISNIGDILYLQGKLGSAEKTYQQALDLMSTTDRADPGYALTRIADLELTEGKLKEAKLHAQQAIESMRPSQGSFQYLSGAMIELAEALKQEGDLPGARSQIEQSIAMRQKMGASDLVAESQVELAALSLEEGHPVQAESLLRGTISVFEEEKADPDAASAYTHLSQALFMQGKIDDARNAAQRALQLSATSSDPALVIPAVIQKARVTVASGTGAAQAVAELRSISLRAKKLGYYLLECKARIALGESELKTNATAARSQLAAVSSDARSRGFELLARHAELTLSGPGIVAGLQKPGR